MSTKLISQALASSGGGGELPRVVAFFLPFLFLDVKVFYKSFFQNLFFILNAKVFPSIFLKTFSSKHFLIKVFSKILSMKSFSENFYQKK